MIMRGLSVVRRFLSTPRHCQQRTTTATTLLSSSAHGSSHWHCTFQEPCQSASTVCSRRPFSVLSNTTSTSRHISHSKRQVLFSSTSNSTEETNPSTTIQQAITSLDDFGLQLQTLAERVDHAHSIQSKDSFRTTHTTVSVAEIALHSRNTTLEEFQAPLAQAARQELLPHAQKLEQELQRLVDFYLQRVQPDMERATKLCQETPCGGATWELDLDRLQKQANKNNSNGTQQIKLEGEYGTLDGTPCGRLQLKSMQFLDATLKTKPQIVMASRARILLELAMQWKAPLQHIRREGTPLQKQSLQTAFGKVVPTPWIRSDAEYQELKRIQQELLQSGGGGGETSN